LATVERGDYVHSGSPPFATRWHPCSYNGVIFPHITCGAQEDKLGDFVPGLCLACGKTVPKATGYPQAVPAAPPRHRESSRLSYPAGRMTRRCLRKSTRT
jgi:hypothetical protein